MTEHTLHDNMRWKYMKRYFALAVIMCLLCLGVCLAGCSAKTESTDHTVTFDWKYNGIIDKVPADNGEKVTPPANVYRPNYDFDGWYFEDEYGDGIPWDFENHIVSGDMTLTARWSPAAFFVYFDPNGGVGNTEDSTAYWGEYFTFPTVVREGYYFAGWFFLGYKYSDGVWEINRSPQTDPRGDGNCEVRFTAYWVTYTPEMALTFGRYEQDNVAADGAEPLEWFVIDYDRESDRYLLFSKKIIDFRMYNNELERGVTWKESDIREWLNGELLGEMFSDEELKYVCDSYLEDTGTHDRLFLINKAELKEKAGFDKRFTSTRSIATPYALTKEHEMHNDSWYSYWLRTSYCSAMIAGDNMAIMGGETPSGGGYCCYEGGRPCFWLDGAALKENVAVRCDG